MLNAVPHLRLLRDEDEVPPPTRRKKKPKRTHRPIPGLYKPTTPCRNCEDCEATPKRTCKEKVEQRNWVLRRTINCVPFQASTRCADRKVAESVARELIEGWEREAVGLKPKERGRRKLDDALEKFAKFLTGGRGKEKQQAKVMRQLREVFREAGKVAALNFVDELRGEVYTDWLPYARERDSANRTINDRIRALQRFGKWLRADQWLPHDPFEILVLLSAKKDLRMVSRAMWPDEAEALIRAARRRQVEEELAKNASARTKLYPAVVRRRKERLKILRWSGYVRALVYFLFLHTGLRTDEARTIRICDVQFEQKQIRVSPEACKVSEEQVVQLDDDLARHLRSYIRRLGDVDETQPLFGYIKQGKDGPVLASRVPAMGTFNKDLAHAGIAKEDAFGRRVVRHSLRKSYITYLWMLPDPKIQDIQRLARHSDIKLTQAVYTAWEMVAGREWAAAERLAGWLRRDGGLKI